MKIARYFLPTLFIALAMPEQAQATHVLSGQITATPVSDQSLTYRLKFTLYTDPHADVEFGTMEITFGYGNPINIDGENDFNGVVPTEDSLFRIDTLVITRTFPGPGQYLISLREFNRGADIVNMRNSVNTPFYVETLLTIDPALRDNRSPFLSDSVVFDTHVGTRFVHAIGATDPDGDSLSYTLVVPKQGADRQVEVYTFPDQFDTLYAETPGREDGSFPPLLTVDQDTLIWDAPTYGGEYVVAFQVKEWRQINGTWKELGYVTRDLIIRVQDTIHHTNGLDYVDYNDYVTGTDDETGQPRIVVYPNPTEGQLHLKIHTSWTHSQVTVQDMTGRLIYRTSVNQEENILELPHLSSGLYVLTLQKGWKQKSFAFMKQ